MQSRMRKIRPHPKVRTGCITCKIRRVRCDEGKPTCQNCATTGRICDGYKEVKPKAADGAFWKSAPTAKTGVHSLPSTALTISVALPLIRSEEPGEVRMLHLFRHRTLNQLWQATENSKEWSWRIITLQMVQTEPAIRHAIIALTGAHESYKLHNTVPSQQDSLTLVHYNKAIGQISALLQDPSSNPQSIAIVLMACSCFAQLEVLLGHDSESVAHLRSALRLLRQYRITSTNLPFPNNDSLEGTLQRASVHVASFPSFDPSWASLLDEWTLPRDHEGPLFFANYATAYGAFYGILAKAYKFLHSTSLEPNPLNQYAAQVRDQLIFKISQWVAAFRQYLTRDGPNLGSMSWSTATLLVVYAKVVSVKLATKGFADEISYDLFGDELAQLLPPLRALAQKYRVHEQAICFSAHGSDVEVLYYVALKCREPGTRREAIDMLGKLAVQNGIWSGVTLAAVARRIVEIEEDGKLVERAADIPETSRVRKVRLQMHTPFRLTRVRYHRWQDESFVMKEEVITW